MVCEITKNDARLQNLRMAVDHYDMPIFAVDLLKEFYETDDPFKIHDLLCELFDLELDIEHINILLAVPEEEPRLINDKESLTFRQLFQ